MKRTFDGKNLLAVIGWLSGLIPGLSPAKKYDVEIKEHREKRSINANGYMWVLCGKLAEIMGMSSEEIYRSHIKEMGLYKDVEISENAVDTLITSWGMHGIGWIAEKIDYSSPGFISVRLYYGSSTYTSKQMARLIDGIVQDCNAVGIETKTPAQLALMCDKWNPGKAA